METGHTKYNRYRDSDALIHDDVIKWKHFPCYWPFARGIHRSSVNSPHKGQWRGALKFSLICAWINDWVNNREAGDLRRHRDHYDVTVMIEFTAQKWATNTSVTYPTKHTLFDIHQSAEFEAAMIGNEIAVNWFFKKRQLFSCIHAGCYFSLQNGCEGAIMVQQYRWSVRNPSKLNTIHPPPENKMAANFQWNLFLTVQQFTEGSALHKRDFDWRHHLPFQGPAQY